MALPAQLSSTTPAGSDSPSLGDDQFRAKSLALIDILGLPDATNVSAALFAVAAAGLQGVIFQDAAANPSATGRLGRNATALLFHDGTAARTIDFLEVAQTISGVKTYTATQQLGKGANIASAAALTLGTDGNEFHVTGTTTITSISTKPAGTVITLVFDGALTLTHNATTLILQDSTNLTTAAGDVVTLLSEGSGNWREKARRLATGVSAANYCRVVGAVGATGSTTTYTFTAADMVLFYNPTSKIVEKIVTAQGSLTNTITTAGPAAGGRDQAGAFSASAYIYLYYIRNGDTISTVSSATAPPTGPVLPTGYTSWAFIAPFRLNGSTQFINTYLRANRVDYQAKQSALSGGTASTFTSVDLSALVPPQAVAPVVYAHVKGETTSSDRSSSVYLSYDGTNTTHAVEVITATGAADHMNQSPVDFLNISQTIYYRSNATGPKASIDIRGYSVANGG